MMLLCLITAAAFACGQPSATSRWIDFDGPQRLVNVDSVRALHVYQMPGTPANQLPLVVAGRFSGYADSPVSTTFTPTGPICIRTFESTYSAIGSNFGVLADWTINDVVSWNTPLGDWLVVGGYVGELGSETPGLAWYDPVTTAWTVQTSFAAGLNQIRSLDVLVEGPTQYLAIGGAGNDAAGGGVVLVSSDFWTPNPSYSVLPVLDSPVDVVHWYRRDASVFLVAGGTFVIAGAPSTAKSSFPSLTHWTPIGSGLVKHVYDYLNYDSEGQPDVLIGAGEFTLNGPPNGTVPCNYVGRAPDGLGAGVWATSGPEDRGLRVARKLLQFGTDILVGGVFIETDLATAPLVAKLSGPGPNTQREYIGTGLIAGQATTTAGAVLALALWSDSCGTYVVAGGNFGGGCGEIVSIAKVGLQSPCSIADVSGIGNCRVPDGLLTGDDFNAFIAAFSVGDCLADVCGVGGPPSPPDGLVSGDDLVAFIAAFAEGC